MESNVREAEDGEANTMGKERQALLLRILNCMCLKARCLTKGRHSEWIPAEYRVMTLYLFLLLQFRIIL